MFVPFRDANPFPLLPRVPLARLVSPQALMSAAIGDPDQPLPIVHFAFSIVHYPRFAFSFELIDPVTKRLGLRPSMCGNGYAFP